MTQLEGLMRVALSLLASVYVALCEPDRLDSGMKNTSCKGVT